MKIEVDPFIVSDNLDLISACQLLRGHKKTLETVNTPRAIAWTKEIIDKLETALNKYNPDYKQYFAAWKAGI